MSNTKEELAPTSDGGESQTSVGIPIDFSPVLVELEKMIVELVELGKEMVESSNAESRIHRRAPAVLPETQEFVTADSTRADLAPAETDVNFKEDILIMSGETQAWEKDRLENPLDPGWKATSPTPSYR